MPYQKNVDQKVEEAIARGEYDDLPGKGKPLDLEAYFAMPEQLRMGYSMLKSAEVIPEEMELLKEIEGLKRSLETSLDQTEAKALRQQLCEKITDFNMRMEQLKRRR